MGASSFVVFSFTFILALSLFTYGFLLFFGDNEEGTVPKISETWWGPGSNESTDTSVRPFRITFSDEAIKDLKGRLKNTRKFVGALEGTGWTYGIDAGNFLPIIIAHWLNNYDFKERESYLNRYPQFVTNIQGLDIHYLRAKPKASSTKKRVLPLLLLHGWPGSVVEFYKILPLLTTPRDEYDFVFEVIAPSLPGFGFSSATTKPGLGPVQIAAVLKNLMLRVGFDKFYAQGGDWGAILTANLGMLYPQHVLGIHSNLCVVLSMKSMIKSLVNAFVPKFVRSEKDERGMHLVKEFVFRKIEEFGYLHIQATKPDTVGVGPSDSPASLAAYVLEKFSTGTNSSFRFREDGGLFEKFTPDELIDNLMMYWIPNSMTTAMRIYSEMFNKKAFGDKINTYPITVPSACAQFPNEIMNMPAELLAERFKKLLRAKKMPRGGHFAAFEEPELLANDIWEMIEAMERLVRKPQYPDKISGEEL